MLYNKLTSSEKYIVDCYINAFYFEKVEIAMKSLNWTYASESNSIPNITKLKNVAADLIAECILRYKNQNEHVCIGIGGFTAELITCLPDEKWYECIQLRFSIEDINYEFTKIDNEIYERAQKLDYIMSEEYQKLLLN